ncbi:MAG: glycosyltransferase family 2 protein, partial [Nanoarchaeota archaeon]
MGIDVSIVLPCRNEEKSVGSCIIAIREVMNSLDYSYEIIVSDSSSDSSPKIAKKTGVRVIKHDKVGYGNALIEGFKAAKGQILVMGDCDNTYNFYELSRFLNAIKSADFVIGSRFKGEIKRGAMPFFHRYLGNPLLTFLLRLFFHTNISDAHSGFRAIKKDAYEQLGLKTTGMEFASEMIIKALKKGLKIKEVSISYNHRVGFSKMRSIRDGWKHLRFMLLFSPMYLFFIPSLFMLFGGIVPFFKSNFLRLVLIVCGYQVFMLGLFAKTYAITKLEEKNRLVESVINNISIEKGIFISVLILLF